MNWDLLRAEAAAHPYPLLFATVSGAHLYGFPSPDSDFDLRGVHVLPPAEVLGLLPLRDTIDLSGIRNGIEMDLVTHDAAKFFRLLLKRNGYVMEQLFSPLIVTTSSEHEELKAIAKRCLTRHHSHHYFGFAATQKKLFLGETPPRVKPLLYTYRVLLTGIWLMRTGEIEANLVTLDAHFRLPQLPELIERKRSGPEKSKLEDAELDFHLREYDRLVAELESAAESTHLPGEPAGTRELSDLLVRIRLGR